MGRPQRARPLGADRLSSSGIARGTRYAVYSLFRYAAVTIGVIFVLRIIEIDWAQFGWIAAALSVGLGFGLREIVAKLNQRADHLV